jgi:hypothetical protein
VYPYSYSISLRAWHRSIDPAIITIAFGMRPDRTWRAGDARSTPKGAPLEGHYKETYWSTEVVPHEEGASEACSLEESLSSLAESLSKHSGFISTLCEGGGHAELFIGLYGDCNFGFELEPRVTQALAAIGLALSFDIYPEPK